MGKNRREKREEEREGFAAKRTAQYRSRNLKALGILSAIAVSYTHLTLPTILLV